MQGRMSPAGYEKRVTAMMLFTSEPSVPPGTSGPAR